MNSDYTRLNNYYKNQNNYIPTRYYCEAFAAAEMAYFDVYLSTDGNVRLDVIQISSENVIKTTKPQQVFTFTADKVMADIKSFNVFVWNGTQFIPSIAASSSNPALFLTKTNQFFNTITLGRTGFALNTALGANNPSSNASAIRSARGAPTAAAPTPQEALFARIYITY